MVEPTETESKATIDYFIEAMLEINKEIDANPDSVRNAPHSTCIKRPDEVKAARQPDLRYRY